MYHQVGQANLAWLFGFRLKPIFAIDKVGLKNVVHFKIDTKIIIFLLLEMYHGFRLNLCTCSKMIIIVSILITKKQRSLPEIGSSLKLNHLAKVSLSIFLKNTVLRFNLNPRNTRKSFQSERHLHFPRNFEKSWMSSKSKLVHGVQHKLKKKI